MATPWRDVGRYGSVGIEFLLSIAIMAFLGHWLDQRWFGGHDWGTTGGFVLGVAVGFRNLVRTALGMQRDIERAEAKDPSVGRFNVDGRWLHGSEAAPPPDGDPADDRASLSDKK